MCIYIYIHIYTDIHNTHKSTNTYIYIHILCTYTQSIHAIHAIHAIHIYIYIYIYVYIGPTGPLFDSVTTAYGEQ